MPELPEVEAIVRSLRPLVCGRSIKCVHVFHPIATKPQRPAQIVEICEGRRVRGVWKRGKYLFLELDHGLIEIHFRLDGHFMWFSNAKELLERANTGEKGAHVDVALEFGRGVLGFADARHFGRVHAWETKEDCIPLQRLGVDALSKEFTTEFLRAKLARSKSPLKAFTSHRSRGSETFIPARRCGRLGWTREDLQIV